jgi:hypothetical protein
MMATAASATDGTTILPLFFVFALVSVVRCRSLACAGPMNCFVLFGEGKSARHPMRFDWVMSDTFFHTFQQFWDPGLLRNSHRGRRYNTTANDNAEPKKVF